MCESITLSASQQLLPQHIVRVPKRRSPQSSGLLSMKSYINRYPVGALPVSGDTFSMCAVGYLLWKFSTKTVIQDTESIYKSPCRAFHRPFRGPYGLVRRIFGAFSYGVWPPSDYGCRDNFPYPHGRRCVEEAGAPRKAPLNKSRGRNPGEAARFARSVR